MDRNLVHVSVPELDSSLSCSDIRLVDPIRGFLTDALDGLRVAPDLDCDDDDEEAVSWIDWETLGSLQQDSLPFSS